MRPLGFSRLLPAGFAILILVSCAFAQSPASSGTPVAPPTATNGTPTNQQPTLATPDSSQPPPPAQDSAAQGSSALPPIAQEPSASEGDMFVFKKQVQEVVLHATVVDAQQHLVPNLDRSAFAVLENGSAQTITSFRREDVPVAIGIVIDNSGSMLDKREAVSQAVLNLIKASNPQDEVFVVNFSDEFFLDQPFTNKINLLQEALEKYETRGGTALYDAVVASADELKKHGKLQRKILFVVTDGEDDASRESLEQAVRQIQEENGPTIYAIGILGD